MSVSLAGTAMAKVDAATKLNRLASVRMELVSTAVTPVLG